MCVGIQRHVFCLCVRGSTYSQEITSQKKVIKINSKIKHIIRKNRQYRYCFCNNKKKKLWFEIEISNQLMNMDEDKEKDDLIKLNSNERKYWNVSKWIISVELRVRCFFQTLFEYLHSSARKYRSLSIESINDYLWQVNDFENDSQFIVYC